MLLGSVTRFTRVSLGFSGVWSSVVHSSGSCSSVGSQFSDPMLVTAFTKCVSQASSSAFTVKVRVSVPARAGIVQSSALGSPVAGVGTAVPAVAAPSAKVFAWAITAVRSSCSTTFVGLTPSVCLAFRV